MKRRTTCLNETFRTNELKLIPLGDIHLGDPNCNIKKLEGTVDYIKKSKDTIVIGMGDYINAALKNSVSDVYSSKYTPEEEYELIIDILNPIKDKFLGLLTGNHEHRIKKDTSIDMTKLMASELDVPYFGWSCFLRLTVGKNPSNHGHNPTYSICATHGGSGATTESGRANAMKKFMYSNQADLYLMGHLHHLSPLIINQYRYYDTRNKCVKEGKRYGVFTGHFLNYTGSYAEMKGYAPGKSGVPKVKLFGDRYDIHVSE